MCSNMFLLMVICCAAVCTLAVPTDIALLQFVHVGKTGGTSVLYWLRSNKIRHNQTHYHQVRHCHAKHQDKWMITIRDPIDRVISAFNWRSPRNAVKQRRTTHKGIEKELYDCFRVVNDFAEALDDNTGCGNTARKAFQNPVAHIGRGVAWYLQDDLGCILQQQPFLVRTDTLMNDLHEAAAWLHLRSANMQIPHTLSKYSVRNQTFLSRAGRKNLRKWTQHDNDVIAMLEVSAENRRTL
mmetsp:Transcript_14381/g.45278  ORF Transcript_14381/g.45278 Transcript_14381/m.45278 type:complete len:240 (-) Transcript_14381:42-761(-)